MSKGSSKQKLSYSGAGVDIEAGEKAVQQIKALAKRTFNASVLSDIGSFGGFFKLDLQTFKSPVLISSADGVGTKLKLAFLTGKHDTVGEDLVNHCVNDILVHGARPLFFLDYIAVGKLKPEIVAEIVTGLSRGCQNAGMALLGGETAEMSDFYQPGEYDLAGFIVGAVDQEKIINGAAVREGDVCLGLASDGLHTNGYTLARKAVFEIAKLRADQVVPELKAPIAEVLMQVHRCYAPSILPLLDKYRIKGMAHVTGGGIPGNLKRIIPEGLSAGIAADLWPVPPVFQYIQKIGGVDKEDMYNTFNMGVGYILVVAPDTVDGLTEDLKQAGETVFRIGQVKPGQSKVQLVW
jgi:phosphoribosylformylglycinamidine cyclo-ligase